MTAAGAENESVLGRVDGAFESPANRGAMERPSVVGKGSLDGYLAFVTFYLRIDRGIISDATFQAERCGVTIACASILTELVRGRGLTECRQITPHDISVALDGFPSGKEYCADVTIAALQDAIWDWE
jgi:nitrogen fixation NifU-like protein